MDRQPVQLANLVTSGCLLQPYIQKPTTTYTPMRWPYRPMFLANDCRGRARKGELSVVTIGHDRKKKGNTTHGAVVAPAHAPAPVPAGAHPPRRHAPPAHRGRSHRLQSPVEKGPQQEAVGLSRGAPQWQAGTLPSRGPRRCKPFSNGHQPSPRQGLPDMPYQTSGTACAPSSAC